MKLKTLTWNIGGGKLLQNEADPTLLALYTKDGLDTIITLLKNEAPDIITLQETHQNDTVDHVKMIADALGYHYVHDSTSESHIEDGFMLGHAILTKHAISKHITGLFHNPKIEIEWEDGSTATSFDKGYTTCLLEIAGKSVAITTLHLIPFKRFAVAFDSDQAKEILGDVQRTIDGNYSPWLIQGDFNIDSETLKPYLPDTFTSTTSEVVVDKPTTPTNYRYDHIICRDGKILNHRIITDVLTDHYPVIAEIEL